MNNKRLGNSFERFMCNYLSDKGYWVHFISPDKRGAQPFDIIAVRDDVPVAIDCKTCKDHIFRIGRLEDNQICAFDKWLSCGNRMAYIAVMHDDRLYMIYYSQLKILGSIDLDKIQASCFLK